MTREEIIHDERELLRPADICDIYPVNPQRLREQAHEDKDKLGFHVSIIGRDIFTPRMAFIKFMGWEVAS